MVAVYEKDLLILQLNKTFIGNPFIKISYVEIVQLSKRTGWVGRLRDVFSQKCCRLSLKTLSMQQNLFQSF